MHGFDPHTFLHEMVIRNSIVHDHGAMGIICSLDCYNITIEDNEVYNSAGSGIMLSRNMHDSIVRTIMFTMRSDAYSHQLLITMRYTVTM
jgi:parallel beta-helix repeat protein